MKKLKEIATITLGYSFRRKIESSSVGNLSIIHMKDISKNALSYKGLYKFETTKRIKKDFFVSAGDILFSAKGTSNNAIYIEKKLASTVSAAHFYIIRVKDRTLLLPEYLAWYINQKPAQDYIQKYSSGTVMNYINRKNLENLEISIPDIATQKKVIALYKLNLHEQEMVLHIQALKNTVINQTLLNKVNKSNKEDFNER